MAKLKEMFSKIKQKIPLGKKHICIVVCILLLCIMIWFSFKPEQNTATKSEQPTQVFDSLEYANQVGANLQSIINNISGISNAKVVVVVEQSPKLEYLTEETTNGKVVVYNKSGSSYEPVIITQFSPQIKGILVVAKGVNNLQLKNNLLNAISAVYNINISCIDILEGK